jgi:SAM-dependent methyltransferase
VSLAFTGERLHAGSALFGVDLERHRAAYRYAEGFARGARVVDLGCGSGDGAARLAEAAALTVGVDRVPPDPAARRSRVEFLRADFRGLPFAPRVFDLAVSFQVIEHLADPGPYLEALAGLLRPGGVLLLTTPNRLTSDGVNPYHVHEYTAGELETRLRRHFAAVECLGVGMSPAVARWHAARLRAVRRILRLDPLRLRERLPRRLVLLAFARLAVRVRRRIERGGSLPEVSSRDFPIGAADPGCLDLLAVCREPRLHSR